MEIFLFFCFDSAFLTVVDAKIAFFSDFWVLIKFILCFYDKNIEKLNFSKC